MTRTAASDVTLSHGGNTVRLRPSLRAAVQLERLHGDFATLFRKLTELDTRTVAAVVTFATTDPEEAQVFLVDLAKRPLRDLVPMQGPLFSLCASLIPSPDEDDDTPELSPKPHDKPTSWPDAFKRLYGYGTGWLGWTPAETWAATPQEIADAFQAHTDKLRAIHGSADEDTEDEPHPKQRDPLGRTKAEIAAQRAQNEAEGLDPDFDRGAFAALKFKIMGN